MHGRPDHLFIVSENAFLVAVLQEGLGARFQNTSRCDTLAALEASEPDGAYLAVVDCTLSRDEFRRLTSNEFGFDLARVLLIASVGRDEAMIGRLIGRVGGILEPSIGIAGVVHAVELILSGVMVYPARLFESSWIGTRPSLPLSNAQPLTDRERRVLSLLCSGRGNKTIAFELGISDATVRVHVRSILRKLGVKNRTQAALKAASTLNWPTPIQNE